MVLLYHEMSVLFNVRKSDCCQFCDTLWLLSDVSKTKLTRHPLVLEVTWWWWLMMMTLLLLSLSKCCNVVRLSSKPMMHCELSYCENSSAISSPSKLAVVRDGSCDWAEIFTSSPCTQCSIYTPSGGVYPSLQTTLLAVLLYASSREVFTKTSITMQPVTVHVQCQVLTDSCNMYLVKSVSAGTSSRMPLVELTTLLYTL